LNEVRKDPDRPVTDDPRHDARAFIFDMLLNNHPYADKGLAAVTASAILWLAKTSPGGLTECGHRAVS
jgi:hypothetical protein